MVQFDIAVSDALGARAQRFINLIEILTHCHQALMEDGENGYVWMPAEMKTDIEFAANQGWIIRHASDSALGIPTDPDTIRVESLPLGELFYEQFRAMLKFAGENP